MSGRSAFWVRATPQPTTPPPSPDTSTLAISGPPGTEPPGTQAGPTVATGESDDRRVGPVLPLALGATVPVTAMGGGALAARRRSAGPERVRLDG